MGEVSCYEYHAQLLNLILIHKMSFNLISFFYISPFSFLVLASWFRLKYPHIALGALASSAPILYFDDITPQNGYHSIVTKDFRVMHLHFFPLSFVILWDLEIRSTCIVNFYHTSLFVFELFSSQNILIFTFLTHSFPYY